MRRAGWALLGGAVLLAGWVIGTRPDTTPQDRLTDISIPPDRALRLSVLGTSLTHNELWPDRLAGALSVCIDAPVSMSVVAKPGAAVSWGLTQIEAVTETRADVVLVEFAINDADIRDGHALAQARSLHETLIADLRAANPQAALVLVTMSPAHGLRGWARPKLRAHYRQYRDITEVQDTGLIDLYPRWLALPRDARGLQQDGLHPDQEVAADVIAPAAAEVLARMMGQGCD